MTAYECEHLLQHSFYSDPGHMIYRYPRYGELFDARNAQQRSGSRSMFSAQELRDVQMWSQLAWFDEEFQSDDVEVRGWVERGRNFTLDEQRRMGEKQREIVGRVMPAYRRLATSGQIEISTTPYYHPILPLLCDSNIAAVAHPNVPLPPRFRYPDDARRQLQLAREYVAQHFGVAPVGLWPSGGLLVSDGSSPLPSELGFQWAATDSGVLDRTQQRAVPVEGLYRPYEWRQGGKSMRLIFRDHFYERLIGFCLFQDGSLPCRRGFPEPHPRELPWHSERPAGTRWCPSSWTAKTLGSTINKTGAPSLRELLPAHQRGPGRARVHREGRLARGWRPSLSDHIFPGSWINANFDIWIGAEEDNQAWTQLLRARATMTPPPASLKPAASWRMRNC